MPHTTRFNYKAKAQSVKNERDNVSTVRDDLINAGQLIKQQLDSATAIQHEAILCAEVVHQCTTLLDEVATVGQVKIDKVELPADSKLVDLPVRQILRRTWQVLNLLGQRVEIFANEIQEYDQILGILKNHAASTVDVTTKIQMSLLESEHIGARPSSAEIRGLTTAREEGITWRRHNVSIDVDTDPEDSEDEDEELQANGQLDNSSVFA